MERPGSVPCFPVISVRMKTVCTKVVFGFNQASGRRGTWRETGPGVDQVNNHPTPYREISPSSLLATEMASNGQAAGPYRPDLPCTPQQHVDHLGRIQSFGGSRDPPHVRLARRRREGRGRRRAQAIRLPPQRRQPQHHRLRGIRPLLGCRRRRRPAPCPDNAGRLPRCGQRGLPLHDGRPARVLGEPDRLPRLGQRGLVHERHQLAELALDLEDGAPATGTQATPIVAPESAHHDHHRPEPPESPRM